MNPGLNVGSEEGHQAPTYSNHHFWWGRDGRSSELIRNHYDTECYIHHYIYIVCNYKYSSIYSYHGITIFTIRNHYIYSYKYVYIYIYIPYFAIIGDIKHPKHSNHIGDHLSRWISINYHPDELDFWWVYSIDTPTYRSSRLGISSYQIYLINCSYKMDQSYIPIFPFLQNYKIHQHGSLFLLHGSLKKTYFTHQVYDMAIGFKLWSYLDRTKTEFIFWRINHIFLGYWVYNSIFIE